MKTLFLLIVASTVMAIFSIFASDNTYGMGAKGNAVQQQEKNVVGQPGSEHRGSRTIEDLSSEPSGTVNRNDAAPKKQPRLKYRDEPGCWC